VAIDGPPGREPVAALHLQDRALSVSAAWGKCFVVEGQTFGHVLDPRTGWPAAPPGGAALAAVALPSATETDAFSTALLTLGAAGHDALAALRDGMATLTLSAQDGDYLTKSRNIPVGLT
jgi:thiamine biosynthesis lipoprotein